MKAIVICILIQIICMLLMIFGDIGFDHPGKYGLDFGHFLLIGMVYLVSLGIGMIVAAPKYKPWILVQLIPIVGFASYVLLTLLVLPDNTPPTVEKQSE